MVSSSVANGSSAVDPDSSLADRARGPSPRVKFCGLVDPADVDAAVALGADALGFVLWPGSPRAVSMEAAGQLRRRVPSSVLAVGLFVNASAGEVAAAIEHIGLDVAQFHGDETPEDCEHSSIPWWRAVSMREAADLPRALARFPRAQALVLDAFCEQYGGSGKTFNWQWLLDEPVESGAGSPLRVLSGGLNPANVRHAIELVRPDWVDVSTGIQVDGVPRRKSLARMEEFMAEVRAAQCAVLSAPKPRSANT